MFLLVITFPLQHAQLYANDVNDIHSSKSVIVNNMSMNKWRLSASCLRWLTAADRCADPSGIWLKPGLLGKSWIYLSGITTYVGLYGVSPKRFKVEKVFVKTKVSNAACDWPSTRSLRCVKCSYQWYQRSLCCMFMLWHMTNPWEHSSVCSHSARVSIQLAFSYRLREFNAHLASAVYYNSRAGRVLQEYCRRELR